MRSAGRAAGGTSCPPPHLPAAQHTDRNDRMPQRQQEGAGLAEPLQGHLARGLVPGVQGSGPPPPCEASVTAEELGAREGKLGSEPQPQGTAFWPGS